MQVIFALGCSVYESVWIFYLGAFLGDVAETLFCRWKTGKWMSRSSVVWGPFSIVWGASIALATVLLFRYKDCPVFFLFSAGVLLGGIFEYLCSIFTEKAFGKVFWDYSKIPYNLNGRINLLYCFFWGIAAVIWFKDIYPPVSCLIKRILMDNRGIYVTLFMIIFMICDILVSCMALVRGRQREKNIKAVRKWQKNMDKYFDDEKLLRIYPNAINVEAAGKCDDGEIRYDRTGITV